MKEPFSLRISDSCDPERGAKFEKLLGERGANATDVLRHLIDAYILSDGKFKFPVLLQELPPIYRIKPPHRENHA